MVKKNGYERFSLYFSYSIYFADFPWNVHFFPHRSGKMCEKIMFSEKKTSKSSHSVLLCVERCQSCIILDVGQSHSQHKMNENLLKWSELCSCRVVLLVSILFFSSHLQHSAELQQPARFCRNCGAKRNSLKMFSACNI